MKSLTCVHLFVTSWTAAGQASLSVTNSRSLLKLMFIESVMPSNHLSLCCPLLLLPSIFPSIRVFSNAAAAAAKLLQSCPTLCDSVDGSPPGSSVPGILQARTLECHFLLQEIFPTQGLNPNLLHCRQTLYHLSHQGSPNPDVGLRRIGSFPKAGRALFSLRNR